MMRRAATYAAVLALGLPLAACTSNSPSEAGDTGDARSLSVSASDQACDVSAQKAPSGHLVFNVKNEGNKVTEFYLLGEDGLRIIGEVENIGPGLKRDLVVAAAPGKYYTVCKPGMVGQGIRSDFTVTKSGESMKATGKDAELLKTANSQYASYVKDQTERLLSKTKKFVRLYQGGQDEKARALYADARMHWERIEPVAESFGDLDPRMDLREADLEEGQKWTGWHRIEKDLWPPKTGYRAMSQQQRTAIADQLLADTKDLHQRTRTVTFTADQIGNGAKELLDEVASGKVTGEEETWSHTDLWDFQANVDGARIAWEGLRPMLKTRKPDLDATLAKRFTDLQKLLDQHERGDGFELYTALSKDEVRQLSDAVNALSEPLSQLTAAVVL